jgi:hypothetical protein
MIRRSIWIVVAIGVGLAAGGAGAAGKEPQYVGVKRCKGCHKKELIGDQYDAWKKGKHAQAFETLKSEEALKIAKEKGLTVPPSQSPDCLKCHVTAYGEPASKFERGPLAPEDGVECESCHGPGSLYKKKKTMADQEKAVAAGLWDPSKDEKICTACHNDESPTWDPAKGFDYEKAKEEIAHPIPTDVKGRFLELERERREEMEGR